MILLDVEAGVAMMPGHTVVIGERGCELLSNRSLALVHN